MTWSYSGSSIGEQISVSTGHTTINVRLQSNKAEKEQAETMEPAGKFETVNNSDGTFEVESFGSAALSVTPRSGIQDVIETGEDVHLADIDARHADDEGQDFDVTLTFHLSQSRQLGSTTAQSRGSGEWLFAFNNGNEIATHRLRQGGGDVRRSGVDAFRHEVALTSTQARMWAESAAKLNAVNVREVQDGTNAVEDNTENGDNTFTLTTPTNGDDILAAGDYIVRDWELEWLNDDYWNCVFTVSSKTL